MPAFQSALQALRELLQAGKAVAPVAAKAKYLAPQENALEIARMNAVRMLGLPENNTALDRARAMGYVEPAYHGSPNPDISSFDLSRSGENTGNVFGDPRAFATSDPLAASGYAVRRDLRNLLTGEGSLPAGQVSEGATVYPLMIRTAGYAPYEAGGKGWMRANRPAIEQAAEQGALGALIRSVQDNPAPALKGRVGDVYATDRPETFRSRFAAFDPARMHESGLMYAQGGLAKMKECNCGR